MSTVWMEKGKRYRVWFQLHGMRVPNAFVGTYLGVFWDGEELFDLRKEHSDMSIHNGNILAYRLTEAEHSAPEPVQDIPSIAEDESTGYYQGPDIKAN